MQRQVLVGSLSPWTVVTDPHSKPGTASVVVTGGYNTSSSDLTEELFLYPPNTTTVCCLVCGSFTTTDALGAILLDWSHWSLKLLVRIPKCALGHVHCVSPFTSRRSQYVVYCVVDYVWLRKLQEKAMCTLSCLPLVV